MPLAAGSALTAMPYTAMPYTAMTRCGNMLLTCSGIIFRTSHQLRRGMPTASALCMVVQPPTACKNRAVCLTPEPSKN